MNGFIISAALSFFLILPERDSSGAWPAHAEALATPSTSTDGNPAKVRTLDSVKFIEHREENIFVIRSAESGTYGNDLACELTAVLLRSVGKGRLIVWKWRDATQDPFTTLAYESGNYRILDVDGEGGLEVEFWCRKIRDGLDPDSVKLLLFSSGKKYGIRAAIPKEPETMEQYHVLPDKSVGEAPAALREYLYAEWNRLVGPEISDLREDAESD